MAQFLPADPPKKTAPQEFEIIILHRSKQAAPVSHLGSALGPGSSRGGSHR
jgi:hypothetical protein